MPYFLPPLLARVEDEVDHEIGQVVHRQARLGPRGAARGVVHGLLDGELPDHVLHADDEVRLARDGHAVCEPPRFAAHGLHDVVAARRHRIGAKVEKLAGHHVDGGEEAEREVDAAVVVVDRLGDVHDADAPGLGRQALLQLEQQVRRAQRVVATDRNERVDLEVDERVVAAAQALGLARVVEVARGGDGLARVGAAGADDDAARVAKAPEVPVLEHVVLLLGLELRLAPLVALQAPVAVQDADGLAAAAPERRGDGADDGVGGRRRPAGEEDAYATDSAVVLRLVHADRKHSPGPSVKGVGADATHRDEGVSGGRKRSRLSG